jgi:hypothetical protein
MKKSKMRLCCLSAAGGTLLTIAIIAIASLPGLDAIGILMAPGIFGAAIVFPEGIHSDAGWTYLALAALIDLILFSLLAAAALTLWQKHRSTQ